MNTFWKNKNILITGAGGFIGSNAVHFFSSLGSNTTGCISPNASKEKININLGGVQSKAKIIRADLLDRKDVENIAKNQEIILHFAAIDGNSAFKKTHSADILSKNTIINLNLFESAVKNNINQLLMMSSADIYTSKAINITEDSPIDISWKHTVDGYKLAKWFLELAANEYYHQYGLKTIIVRASNVYGPRDEFINKERMRFIPSVIQNLYLGKQITLWGNGKQKRAFLYVDDFLHICRILLEKNVKMLPINIASKNTVSLNGVIEKISNQAKIPAHVSIDSSQTSGAFSRTFSLKLLKSKIGQMRETTLEDGINKTLQFYEKYY